MATRKSLTQKLNDLERKLSLENRLHENDRRTRTQQSGSPSPRRPTLGSHSESGISPRSSSAPSSSRCRPDMQLDCHRFSREGGHVPTAMLDTGQRRTGMQLDTGQRRTGMQLDGVQRRTGMQLDTGQRRTGMQLDTGQRRTGMQLDTGQRRTGMQLDTGQRRTGMQLDTGQRQTGMQLDCHRGSSRTADSREIDQKYEEIMKQSGNLCINGIMYHTDIKDMEPMGELGHGTCGQVVKMRHKISHHLMAVKQMRRSGNKEENRRIIMDLDVVLKSHDCPYIVQCLGTFITTSEVWICMELMSTCLDKLLKKTRTPIPERILGKMAVAIVRALHYLKENHGVIHRDVKPSNILLDEKGSVKLCDFGISGRLVDSKAKTRTAGCAAYMAPERIDPPDPQCPDYDIRADVWSLGISLVELATSEFPYKDCKTDFEVLTKVLQEDPPLLPPGEQFSHEFCSFVRDCLTKDYRKRPKYRKLLEHPFIKRFEREEVDISSWYTGIFKFIEIKAS